MKFKKGDTIEALNDRYAVTKGKHYTVVDIDCDGDPYIVDDNGDRGVYYSHNFKLVKRADMKKEDLKTGMLVVYRDGNERVVIKDFGGHDMLVDERGESRCDLVNYQLDLTCKCDSSLSIDKIYSTSNLPLIGLFENTRHRELLWQREEEITELTIEEIAEKFGKDVKNIRIKD